MRNAVVFGAGCFIAGAMLVAATTVRPDPMQDPMQDPEVQKQMEMWSKLAEPGEHHQALDPLVGDWTIATRFRMGPEGDWMESGATQKSEWVLGNRFVSLVAKSPPEEGMEEGFEGRGFIGYDNYHKKYTYLWIDTMSTMMLLFEGQSDSTGKVFTFVTVYEDPMTKQEKTARWVLKVESPSKHIFEMYDQTPEGEEFLMGVLTYTKAASAGVR